jgi:hypothetical protein
MQPDSASEPKIATMAARTRNQAINIFISKFNVLYSVSRDRG